MHISIFLHVLIAFYIYIIFYTLHYLLLFAADACMCAFSAKCLLFVLRVVFLSNLNQYLGLQINDRSKFLTSVAYYGYNGAMSPARTSKGKATCANRENARLCREGSWL